MAKFSNKVWTDRVSEQPQRRLLTPTDGSTAMTVDVTRQEGIVIQEGDAFSASNMNDLEQRIKTAVDANDSAITSVTQKANTNQQNISTLSGTVTAVNSKTTALEGELTANGIRIYMDYKNGRYGYNLSANRGADTFFPFSNVTISQIFSGNVGVSINNTSYFYTTSAEYKYIIVYMEEKDSADINVWLSPTAGTAYFSHRVGHDARIFEIWQNIPAGTRLGLSASRYEQEEKSGTMRGYVFGIST